MGKLLETVGGTAIVTAEPARRGALAWIVRGLGAGLALVYAIPAALYVRGRSRVTEAEVAVDVGALDALKEGVPQRVTVPVHGNDAWSQEGGLRASVFLLRRGERVAALDSTCPHTGCAVEWDEGTTQFRCPCHRSAFSASGERLSGPAPRGLDPEEVEVKAGRVFVRYRRYRTGRPDRVGS